MSRRHSRHQAQLDSYKAVKAREAALLAAHARRSIAARIAAIVTGLALFAGVVIVTVEHRAEHAAAHAQGRAG